MMRKLLSPTCPRIRRGCCSFRPVKLCSPNPTGWTVIKRMPDNCAATGRVAPISQGPCLSVTTKTRLANRSSDVTNTVLWETVDLARPWFGDVGQRTFGLLFRSSRTTSFPTDIEEPNKKDSRKTQSSDEVVVLMKSALASCKRNNGARVIATP